jgi:hypothetical protein
VIALGQSGFSFQEIGYAYIEIWRWDGRVTRADDVVVLNRVGSLLQQGVDGQFDLDAARLRTAMVRQRFGIRRNDGRRAYDAAQVRLTAAVRNVVQGALTAFIFVGVPFLLISLLQLVFSIGTARLRHGGFIDGDASGDGRVARQDRGHPEMMIRPGFPRRESR